MIWDFVKGVWWSYMAKGPEKDIDYFDRCMDFVLQWEGGYVNDPKDPGGETKYGISKRTHPNEDIKNITKERAKEIYKKAYWDKCGASEMGWPECLAIFDAAVNCGVGRARQWVSLSGSVKTRAAYTIERREEFYHDLVLKKPVMRRFLKGWLNRTQALKKTAGL